MTYCRASREQSDSSASLRSQFRRCALPMGTDPGLVNGPSCLAGPVHPNCCHPSNSFIFGRAARIPRSPLFTRPRVFLSWSCRLPIDLATRGLKTRVERMSWGTTQSMESSSKVPEFTLVQGFECRTQNPVTFSAWAPRLPAVTWMASPAPGFAH